MAAFALTSVTTTLNGSDITADLKSATLTLDGAQLDTTDFASAGWVEMIGGLKSGTLNLEFQDDMTDTTGIDDKLFAMFNTVVAFTIKPTSAATSASNPVYSGNVFIGGHELGGAVGDLAGKSLSFPTSGAVTRSDS